MFIRGDASRNMNLCQVNNPESNRYLLVAEGVAFLVSVQGDNRVGTESNPQERGRDRKISRPPGHVN